MLRRASSPLPSQCSSCRCRCRYRRCSAKARVDATVLVVVFTVVFALALTIAPASISSFNIIITITVSAYSSPTKSTTFTAASLSQSSFHNHYLIRTTRHAAAQWDRTRNLKAYPDNNSNTNYNSNNNNNNNNNNYGKFENDEDDKYDYFSRSSSSRSITSGSGNRSFRKDNANPFGTYRKNSNNSSGFSMDDYNYNEVDDDDEASYRLARELAARRGINVLNTDDIDGGQRRNNRQRLQQQQLPLQREEDDTSTSASSFIPPHPTPQYNTNNIGGGRFGSRSSGGSIGRSSVGDVGSDFRLDDKGDGWSSLSKSRDYDNAITMNNKNKFASGGDRLSSSSSSYEVIVVTDDEEDDPVNKFSSYMGRRDRRGDDGRQWRTPSSRKITTPMRPTSTPIPPTTPPTKSFTQWQRQLQQQQQIVQPPSPPSSSRLRPPMNPQSSSSFAATASSSPSWTTGRRNYGDSGGGSSSQGSSINKPSTNFNSYGRNAYRNAMPKMRQLSPPLSELASWSEDRGRTSSIGGGGSGRIGNDGVNTMRPPMRYTPLPMMGRYPQQGIYSQQQPSTMSSSPYNQQLQRQRGRPPPPPPPPYSVPLSLLAIQPHIEPLDRDISGASRSSSPLEYKSPLPFTGLDSSEFRRPYEPQEQQSMVDRQRQPASYAGSGSAGASAQSQWQRQRQEQLQQEIWRQQQQQQSSTKTPTNSFKPLPFQSMSQADFRQPFPGHESNEGNGRDNFDRSAQYNDGPPPFPYEFGVGYEYDIMPSDLTSPNNNQPSTSPTVFEFNDPMLFSPFMVPPMLFPPLSVETPQRQTQPSSPRQDRQQEEGVKVPKDPFLERQKKSQTGQFPSSPSKSDSNKSRSQADMRIPKDPFAERRKEQGRRQQQSQLSQQLQRKDESILASDTGDSRGTTAQFNEQQQPEKKPREPIIRSDKSRKVSSTGMKLPRDPFVETARRERRPQSTTPSKSSPLNDGNRGLGSVSFGSRSGEDMTYEEYSSYFDTP